MKETWLTDILNLKIWLNKIKIYKTLSIKIIDNLITKKFKIIKAKIILE